jgi:hypothetical protein
MNGASPNINSATFTCYASPGINYIDDIVFGTGGYPGDVRIEAKAVNSDTTHEWTSSTGATGYGVIDDIPASTTDYIKATNNAMDGDIDLHGHAAWDGTGKTPLWVSVLHYLSKDATDDATVKLLDSNGSTTRESSSITPPTTAAFYENVLTTASDGSAWDTTKVNALLTGVKAEIPA